VGMTPVVPATPFRRMATQLSDTYLTQKQREEQQTRKNDLQKVRSARRSHAAIAAMLAAFVPIAGERAQLRTERTARLDA